MQEKQSLPDSRAPVYGKPSNLFLLYWISGGVLIGKSLLSQLHPSVRFQLEPSLGDLYSELNWYFHISVYFIAWIAALDEAFRRAHSALHWHFGSLSCCMPKRRLGMADAAATVGGASATTLAVWLSSPHATSSWLFPLATASLVVASFMTLVYLRSHAYQRFGEEENVLSQTGTAD
jgi:hypothetical protein